MFFTLEYTYDDKIINYKDEFKSFERPNLDRVLKLENSFISYKLNKEFNGLSSYFFLFEVKDGVLAATFDENGKLLSVVEKFNNAKLPEIVRKSLADKFPEWILVKDKYLYVQKNGEVKRKEYKIIMKKGNKIRRIVVNEDGVIIRGRS